MGMGTEEEEAVAALGDVSRSCRENQSTEFDGEVRAQGVSVKVSVRVESEDAQSGLDKSSEVELQPEAEDQVELQLKLSANATCESAKSMSHDPQQQSDDPVGNELVKEPVQEPENREQPVDEPRENSAVSLQPDHPEEQLTEEKRVVHQEGSEGGRTPTTPTTPSSTSGVEQWFAEDEDDEGVVVRASDLSMEMDGVDLNEQPTPQESSSHRTVEVIDVQVEDPDSESDRYETASSDDEPVVVAPVAAPPEHKSHKRRKRPASSVSTSHHKKRPNTAKRKPTVSVNYSKLNSSWSHKSQEEILKEFACFDAPPIHGEAEPIMKGKYFFDHSTNRAVFEGKWGFEGTDLETSRNVSSFFYNSSYLQMEGLFPYSGGYGGWFEFRPFSQRVRKITEKQLELMFVPLPHDSHDDSSMQDEDSDVEVAQYRVYGKGRNQFGEYHLLGKYNSRNEQMELKRRYDG